MITKILNIQSAKWLLIIYILVLLWWLKLQFQGIGTSEAYIFNWTYGLIALVGGINGINIAFNKWGGWQSTVGKGLIFLSCGLLCQWFGLQVWTYYNIIAKIEVPYPSIADIGYLGLIPTYALAAWLFAQASGARFSLKTIKGKIIITVIPFFALLIAYLLFLREIGFDLENPIKAFFDFGYPLGEIIPVSIALFTLMLSRNYLGGKMKSRVLYLIFAFVLQFLTEYAFLYSVGVESYVNGGWNDIMYATSYIVMSLGILTFSNYDN